MSEMSEFATTVMVQKYSHEGKETYTITIEGEKIEHAYKEEIINYLVTDEFTYDEDLTLFNK